MTTIEEARAVKTLLMPLVRYMGAIVGIGLDDKRSCIVEIFGQKDDVPFSGVINGVTVSYEFQGKVVAQPEVVTVPDPPVAVVLTK